jgi:hypothetical protein
MATKSTQVFLPPQGKENIDLNSFNYKVSYRDCLFTIFLPCAVKKPYYKSKTHHYINLKLDQYIPSIWRKLIRICTISEVVGIIPQELEDKIFHSLRKKYNYEHYPSYQENDIERTSEWLRDFLEIDRFRTKYNFSYCTSKVFRAISLKSGIECLPTNFKKSSALFEFRKTKNVKELTEKIENEYIKLLKSRFERWKNKDSHSYQVLKFAKKNRNFKLIDFKKKFKHLKRPSTNIKTFCHESDSDKGVFFKYNKEEEKYHFPEFIQSSLKF